MIKQYPAKEQAELRVRVQVPGSWFGGLLPAERRQHYEAEAYDWKEAHHFPKVPRGWAAQTCPAIKFLCETDVFEDPKHDGFIAYFFIEFPISVNDVEAPELRCRR